MQGRCYAIQANRDFDKLRKTNRQNTGPLSFGHRHLLAFRFLHLPDERPKRSKAERVKAYRTERNMNCFVLHNFDGCFISHARLHFQARFKSLPASEREKLVIMGGTKIQRSTIIGSSCAKQYKSLFFTKIFRCNQFRQFARDGDLQRLCCSSTIFDQVQYVITYRS